MKNTKNQLSVRDTVFVSHTNSSSAGHALSEDCGSPISAAKSRNGNKTLALGYRILLCALFALPLAAQVPTQYQAIYSNMSSQISAFQTTVNQNWNQVAHPVAWAPHLSGAESDQFTTLLAPGYYQQTVLTELQELQATGATAVTVHINFPILYQPFYTYENNPAQYAQFVAFYQQLISDVHARGMKLVVEALVSEALAGTQGAAFIPYYQSLDWNDYMNARAQNTVNVAQLIQPDYMSLICEPDSEATNALQPTEDSPSGAMQLLETDLAALQAANVTNVTIGAGAGTWIPSFTSYIQEFATTPINYIDMHIYPVNDNDLTNILTGSSIAQQAGLKIGVSENWPDKEADSELGTLDINTIDSRDVFSFWSPIDQAFMQAMVACAQYEQFLFDSPSFPEYWANYLDYNTYGGDSPTQLLPIAFAASAVANDDGTFTSTGQAFSTLLVGPDTIPPSTPPAPSASIIGAASVTLAWTPSTDNVGVAGYNIYRNGVIVAQDAISPYLDSNLTPGLTYAYNLSAFDVAENVSGISPVFNVTTINTTVPSVPANLAVTGITQNSVSLSWAPSVDSGGVGGYRVLKGTSRTNLQVVAPAVTTTSYIDSNVTPSTPYYYEVEAYNTNGINSAPGGMVTGTTLALPAPTNLAATAVSNTSISLAWTPSGGTDAPVGYRILKGSTPSALKIIVASNAGTTYTDTAVATKTTYYYEVEMVDSLGLTSVPSNMLTATTQANPTAQAPTGLAVTNVTNTQVVLTWNASTGADPIASYRVLRGTSPSSLATIASGVTATTYTNSNLTPATTYYYEIEAVDAKGLASPPCAIVMNTTLPLPQAPTGLTVTTNSKTSVTLNWNAPLGSDPAVSYKLYKGTSPTSLNPAATGLTATSYTDTKVGPSSTYYYDVIAMDANGQSSVASSQVSVTP